jgi:protocatechuate 3,4-dioxygenase beta subunit
VRVVSDQFVDKNLPPLTIVEREWYDAGDIRLERGTTLHGRVTIEGSNGLPVPDAEVQIKAQNQFPSVSPTPGREDGLLVKVDHTGSFRIHNAPAGIVTVAAVAPGYARIEKAQLTLDAQADNEVLFELPPGLAIGGVVIDAAGNPIEGAKVEATAISAKTPANGSARSGADGRFEVIGLVGGPYLVTAAAQGYVRVPLKPIQAGTENLEIVLEKQCEAQVRVFDKNNQILRAYTLEVQSYTEGQELFGNTDIPVKRVRTDADGIATVGGLDPEPGRYVFQITAPGHCKAYSEPFKVAIGEKPPLVEVRMNEGGILVGRVTDQRGQPLANVKVQTLPNHYDENPFTSMFRGIIPVNITQQTVTTDNNGEYRFTLLTPGEYQLKFWHPQHFEVFLKNNIVEAGQTTTVGPLAMEHGTVVSGEVRFQGSPAPQAKVTISSATDPEAPSPILFTCDAITDNEGRFTMSKRVPPGRYQVMAARQTLQNPLEQIADFHRTKQEITLGRGQDKYFLQVVIPE